MRSVCTIAPARPLSRAATTKPLKAGPVRRSRPVHVRAETAAAAPPAALPQQAISLTDKALDHLKRMRTTQGGGDSLLLRVGIKQGGCSGLSYSMDFEQPTNITPDDHVMEYDNGSFRLVTDPKSLLYLFGMRLEYSDALVGGGFQFHNPNATESCGCGKSFGV